MTRGSVLLALVFAGAFLLSSWASADAPYGIRSIPTILFFKEGAIVDRVLGAAPKTVLQGIVNARA